MGEHARALRDERRAERADAAAGGLVLVADGVRLGEELGRARAEARRHAAHGPGQVHRGGPGAGELRRRLAEPRQAGAAPGLHREAVRRRHADGRRAAHGQVLDGRRHLVGAGELEPALLGRERLLVEQAHQVARVVVQHRPERFTLRHGHDHFPSPANRRSAK